MDVMTSFQMKRKPLHIIPSNDVETKNDLFNTLCYREHAFMRVLKNDIDCLIKTSEISLSSESSLSYKGKQYIR